MALWEERNNILHKKVQVFVQKERNKIRKMIVAAEITKPKKAKVLKTATSYGSLASKSTAIGST